LVAWKVRIISLPTKMESKYISRHRFTASYVQTLLHVGITSPHTLLSQFIARFTEITPTDGKEDISLEPKVYLHKALEFNALNFEKLGQGESSILTTICHLNFILDIPVMMTIHRLLLHYLIRGNLLQLTEQEARMVQYGFAHFQDDKTIRADEPLVLLAASHWFKDKRFAVDEYAIHALRSAPGRGEGWEDFLAVYFVQAFESGRPLDHIFDFHGTTPPWSRDSAELVALSINFEEVDVSPVHMEQVGQFCLGFDATKYSDDLQWLKNPKKQPFLFPSNFMGPDLIFVLRLSNEHLLWVVVEARYRSKCALDNAAVENAIKTLTPSKFYLPKVSYNIFRIMFRRLTLGCAQDGKAHAHTVMPTLKNDIEKFLLVLPTSWNGGFGKFSLMRVIAAFPAEALKDTLKDNDNHALATLNVERCKQVRFNNQTGSILEALEQNMKGQKRKVEMMDGDDPEVEHKSQRSHNLRSRRKT
jgi:hypothetical protein